MQRMQVQHRTHNHVAAQPPPPRPRVSWPVGVGDPHYYSAAEDPYYSAARSGGPGGRVTSDPVSEVSEYVVSEEEAAVKSLHFRAVKAAAARAGVEVARPRAAVTGARGNGARVVTRAAGRAAGSAGLEEA
jgi:hypothetical protein